MKKFMPVILTLFISSIAIAGMSIVTITIPSGQTRDITADVPWPAATVIARMSPPAVVNGEIAEVVGFCLGSRVDVTGPTTVTIEYGEPDLATPDAIGGGE